MFGSHLVRKNISQDSTELINFFLPVFASGNGYLAKFQICLP